AAARSREFDCVFYQVPKDLLETAGVRVHKVPRGIELDRKLEFFGVDIKLADFDRLPETQTHVSRFAMKFKLAARDTRQIEAVVDEMSLQIQIAPRACPRSPISSGTARLRREALEARDQARARAAQRRAT